MPEWTSGPDTDNPVGRRAAGVESLPWTRSGVCRTVEPSEDRIVCRVDQRAVVLLDHLHASAHDPGQLERRDPCRERVRGERRT